MSSRFLLALAFCLFVPSLSASEPQEARGTIGNGGLLLIEGKVNEKSIRGVVDTGSSHHGFDRKLIPFLEGFESVNSKSSIEVCDPQRVTIGPLSDVVKAGSGVVDLTPFELKAEERIDAVIGMPFLFGRVIRINPSCHRFKIQETGVTSGKGIHIHPDDLRRPCVSVTIAGEEFTALIDTGTNAEITANADDFETILKRLPASQEVSTVNAQNLEGLTPRRKIASCDITIGCNRVLDVAITESESTSIGMGFLKRFAAVIDLWNLRLQLKPLPGN